MGYHDTWSVRINKIKLGTIRSAWNLWSPKIAIVCFLGSRSLSHFITLVEHFLIPHVFFFTNLFN